MEPNTNLANNRQYYDQHYAKIDLERFARRLQDPDRIFELSKARILTMEAFYAGHFAERLAGKKVLEIGSGNGLNAVFMAHFGARVCSNDISAESAAFISRLSERLGLDIETTAGSLTDIDLPGQSFDMVVGKSIIHHLNPETEIAYMDRIVQLLKPNGTVRFVEPAHNRPWLRKARMIFPDGRRPSILDRKQFAQWQSQDKHPPRDNSSTHFQKIGRQYFQTVNIRPFGIAEQLLSFLPGSLTRKIPKKQLRTAERLIPYPIALKLAKVQVIDFAQPQTGS